MERTYIAIDLKSFYASVECVERDLNPMNTCLVVADASRTDKTICLAVSPGLKSFGVPGRPRLFEVKQAVGLINNERKRFAPGRTFNGASVFTDELKKDASLELDFIAAPPRMALYMRYSTDIYKIYLKYVSPDDIHVYSCDEVFIDVTEYQSLYKMSAHDLASTIIKDILTSTGITATCGIGTNMFLCKVAMDIVAKHIPADKDGVRIAELDERSFREKLWNHTPLTDFWGFGPGTQRRLNRLGLYTLGDVCAYSERCEDNLYKAFGVNAEIIIDHAWGWEPCTIEAIKNYRPSDNSLSSGQVLTRPYSFDEARTVIKEMAENLALDLLSKGLVSGQIVVNVGYEHFTDEKAAAGYSGDLTYDHYGRLSPKHAHGTENLTLKTSSARLFREAAVRLFDRITDPSLMVRRLNIAACHVVREADYDNTPEPEQLSLFVDYEAREKEKEILEKEKSLQLSTLYLKRKYGKNAVLKGTDFLEGATARERNMQIGGHKAGSSDSTKEL